MHFPVTFMILQFCCGQAPAGSPSFSTFAAGQLGKNSSTCGNAAAFTVRRLATATASSGTSQKLQETAKGKMQSMLAVPTAAVKSAKQGVRNTTNAVYKQIPRPVSLAHLQLYLPHGAWYNMIAVVYLAGSALGHLSGQARWSATGCHHPA